ncbi:MAG: 6,7-dimethyl-8-ribityllumazine synthase [Spirochaetes bacterium]|nr:6,7-dimethyl-8-ribityllumazine synthase [Spirochaetota bacterium]
MKEINGELSAKGKRFGIILSRFNDFIGSKLLTGAVDCLIRHGCDPDDLTVARVPGAFEIPAAAKKLLETLHFDAVICIGVIIRGATPHFEYITREVTEGIARLNLESGIPLTYGIITADTQEQAIERAGAKAGNKGWEAALSAIEMADLFHRINREQVKENMNKLRL